MHPGTTEEALVDQLLKIASDADLRQSVYERLGDYCHQCRNRLNSLKLSIYLAMKQAPPESVDHWTEIDRRYQELEKRVEQVQMLCRPIVLSRVTLGLDLLIDDRREAWEGIMAEVGKDLTIVPPKASAVASFDVERLGKVLDSVVSWRAADQPTARSAKLRWWVESGQAHLSWEEPAPTTPRPHEGSDWTLPLLSRVIQAHGGNYEIETDRGWRLEVAWPSQTVTT